MSLQSGRYKAGSPSSLAEGWSLERLTPVSRLFGANGMSIGPDGLQASCRSCGNTAQAADRSCSGQQPRMSWGWIAARAPRSCAACANGPLNRNSFIATTGQSAIL